MNCLKIQSVREASGSSSNQIGFIRKKPDDKFLIAVDYQRVLSALDVPSSVEIKAYLNDDDTEVTSTLLEAYNGGILSGTVESGSTTTLVDSSENFNAHGVSLGDAIVNITKNQRMIIEKVTKGVTTYDTLTYNTQALAAAVSDAWKILYCPVFIKAGTTGKQYRVNFKMTSVAGVIFSDTIQVKVLE